MILSRMKNMSLKPINTIFIILYISSTTIGFNFKNQYKTTLIPKNSQGSLNLRAPVRGTKLHQTGHAK